MTKVCRICLARSSNPRPLVGRRVAFLEEILGKAIMYASANSWLCVNCAKMIDKCTAFKKLCLKAELFWEKYYRKLPENKSSNNESHETLPANNEQACTPLAITASGYAKDCKPVKKYASFDSTEENAHNSMSPTIIKMIVSNHNADEDDPSMLGHIFEHPVKIEVSEIPQPVRDDVQFVKSTEEKEDVQENECDIRFDGHHSDDSEINAPLKKIVETKPKCRNYINTTFKKNEGILIVLSLEEQFKELEMFKKDEIFLQAKYKCWNCAIVMKKSTHVKKHMLQHFESSGCEVCEVCTRRFSTARELKRHKKYHARRVICQFCGLRLPILGFRAHIAEHKGVNSYPCDQCSQVFKKQLSLTLHKRNYHISEENLLRCDHCPKTFKHKCKLIMHMISHSSNPEHRCEECGKVLLNKYFFDKHKLMHKTHHDSFCVECNIQFKSPITLRYHYMRHSRHVTPKMLKFQCDKCSKAFVTERQLILHKSTHGGVKRFACDKCSNSYTSKANLNIHNRSRHMGHKNPCKYLCTICNQKFKASASLKRHIRFHTGEKPFECEICNTRFSQLGEVKTHKRSIHKPEFR